MPRTGKCPNYTRCLLAARDEIITLPDDAPFVCPECKLPLLAARADGRKPITIPVIILGGISMLVISAAIAVYIQVRHFRETQAPGQIGTSFEQAEVAAEHGEFMPSRHMAIVDTPNPATSGIQAQAPNLQDPRNQRVRDDVLKRIALMPASSGKDKLSMSLQSTRLDIYDAVNAGLPQDKLSMFLQSTPQMGRIITIPFPPGHVALSPADVDQLRAVLASAEVQPFLANPACVLVVLGFADLKGDENTGLHISTERAQSVLNTLRDRCGVTNVMYAVGMGASTLFGNGQDADRNRLVEIWVALP